MHTICSQIYIGGYVSFGRVLSHNIDMLPINSSAIPIIVFLSTILQRAYYRVSNDSFVLSEVVRIITSVNPNLTEFSPTMTLITTWSDVSSNYFGAK